MKLFDKKIIKPLERENISKINSISLTKEIYSGLDGEMEQYCVEFWNNSSMIDRTYSTQKELKRFADFLYRFLENNHD